MPCLCDGTPSCARVVHLGEHTNKQMSPLSPAGVPSAQPQHVTGRRNRWQVTKLPGETQTPAAASCPSLAAPRWELLTCRAASGGPALTPGSLEYHKGSLLALSCVTVIPGHWRPCGGPDPKCSQTKRTSKETQVEREPRLREGTFGAALLLGLGSRPCAGPGRLGGGSVCATW